MKVGFIADPHYSSAELTCEIRHNSLSLEKIRQAYADFRQCGCEQVILLGDLTDTEPMHDQEIENVQKIRQIIKESGIPTAAVMGNHDAVTFTPDEFYNILGEEMRPRDSLFGNTHVLFLDACYYYTNGLHYSPEEIGSWMDTFYPFTDTLEKTLATLDGDVCICLHQNIDPTIHESHRLHNDASVRRILENSGRVRCVYQGHYHPGSEYCENQIRYKTFPAMCEQERAWFVEEL